MAYLSEHFLERELNVESAPEAIKNIARFGCENILEAVRAEYGPLVICSGYRCPEHNQQVGGVSDSYHLYVNGKGAADFHVPGCSITEVFNWLRQSHLPFDKVILEYDSTVAEIVHVQWALFPFRERTAWRGETHGRGGYTQVECA